MAHPAPNTFQTAPVPQDPHNGPPPPHWHGQSYANAVAGPFQTPTANPTYVNQGFRGPDGRGPDGPVTQEEQYHFSLRPVANSTLRPTPIDPSLQRDDHGHAPFIHHKHRVEHDHQPRSKKQDARPKPSHKSKKGKNKEKAHAITSDSESDVDPPRGKTRTGRSGVQNYKKLNQELLLEAVAEILPTGEKGWRAVEELFNTNAGLAGRPERTMKSLRDKFQRFLKEQKPTGDPHCPPEVKRAHELEDLINTKVATRAVGDETDNDDGDNDSSDSDAPKVVEPVRSAVARRAPTPPLRRSRAPADTLGKIVSSLDPAALRARDEARARHSFERTQLMTITAQMDGMRTQIAALQQENNDLKRQWDLADMERTLTARFRGHSRSPSRYRSPSRRRSPSRHRHRGRGRGLTSFEERNGLQRVRGKVRVERRFPEGGAMTTWHTDASSDATDFDFRPKKKQRQHSPTPYSRTPTPSPRRHRSISRRRTPTPGPSRYRSISPRRMPTPGPSHLPTSDTIVSGNAVELVATPRRGGAPIRFIISPAAAAVEQN
ncbi:hypothetical protein C8R45DRAFT_1091618 [Mycena sanguinolenta]|nr:hypothetical protein C8R45DRAFT_1091618 [Mycena sanguinolenta]